MRIKIPGMTSREAEKVLEEHLRGISTGLKMYETKHEGNYVIFTLRMKETTPTRRAEREDPHHSAMQFRKRGHDLKRWTGAVCFHGYKEYMDRIFFWHPEAIIRTKAAAYKGIEDYKAKWVGVGMQNVGSRVFPVQYRECCDCYGG